MSPGRAEARPRESRVPFGVPDLDTMLEGGLRPHRPYLIVGPAGTGKTTLALQFLCEGVRRGERCLYVTLEDPPNEVRWNHRALRPALDSVDVFDAIPDVMRYERVPFKDISAVREVLPFGRIPETIRRTGEFTSVEVTGTALEQMLRSEVQKRAYSRLVIDSLTALQYFCMKGFDPSLGAQTFLRFLTELRTTTILTVESPLEDLETPERMLARGEVRLFRWESEGVTVRAIGVEKFRGSSHDVRLHPYRIGSRGLDIALDQTISRDTRQIVEPALTVALRGEAPAGPSAPVADAAAEPLSEQIADLVTVGADVAPLRQEVEAATAAAAAAHAEELDARIARIAALAVSLAPVGPPPVGGSSSEVAHALQRIEARAERIREGLPPTRLPSLDLVARELGQILEMIPPTEEAAASASARATRSAPASREFPTRAEPAVPIPPPAAVPAEGPSPDLVEPGQSEPSPTLPPLPPLPAPPRTTFAGAPAPAHAAPPTEWRSPGATVPLLRSRRAVVVSSAEPPPLPRPPALHPPPRTVPPAPAGPPGGTPARPTPATAPRATAVVPRRRRRPVPTKTAPMPEPIPAAEPAPGTAEPSVSAAPPMTDGKLKRRSTRRKRAPKVVAAQAVVPLQESAPAPAAPRSPAETPDPTEPA